MEKQRKYVKKVLITNAHKGKKELNKKNANFYV